MAMSSSVVSGQNNSSQQKHTKQYTTKKKKKEEEKQHYKVKQHQHRKTKNSFDLGQKKKALNKIPGLCSSVKATE